MKKIYIALVLIILPLISLLSQTMEVKVEAGIDNTIFQGSETSNGAGQYLFCGQTNKGVNKRALVMFDLESMVPEGVTVDSATIVMIPTKVKPGTTTVTVSLVTSEWGEGASEAVNGDGKGAPAEANDATWIFTKFDKDRWVKSGGDFAVQSSAVSEVSLGKNALFSSERITIDVNFWLNNPSKNYGWIFIGDESKNATSVKFGSKENSNIDLFPVLKLYYQGETSLDQLAESESGLSVFQGSVMDRVTISNSGKPGSCTMEIFSITGARQFTGRFDISSGENTVETGIRQSGIYVYRIIHNNTATSGKLLITEQ